MGPVPMQRDTVQRPTPLYPLRDDARSVSRTSLPGNPLAPCAARRFVRAALADWTNLGLLATCAFCRGTAGRGAARRAGTVRTGSQTMPYSSSTSS